MVERKDEKMRRGEGRKDFLQRRAERRARRRMATGQADSPETRISFIRRLGWTLQETGWTVQEKLLWPIADWARIGFEAALWPLEKAVWTVQRKLLWPFQDRISNRAGESTRVPRAATLGALGALALGALGAGALLASDGGEATPSDSTPTVVAQVGVETEETEKITPIVARTEPKAKQPALKGIKPSFGARTDEERSKAQAALRKLEAEERESANDPADAAASSDTEGNESDAEATRADNAGSAEADTAEGDKAATDDGEPASGATASNSNPKQVRRQESPLNVAERFAMAFVSYEVGASGRPIETAFKDTADTDLFDSLMDRPPRQPNGGKVPKARVVNVVGGPRKKKSMEISVGLLRVDGISEIRLDMKRLGRGWVVKTVRG